MAREQGRSVPLSEQVIDLSLSDAVYLGLRNNRGIRSAYLQRIAQKFDLRVAADAFNPKLAVRGDYHRANRATEDRTRTSNVSPTATPCLANMALASAWPGSSSSAPPTRPGASQRWPRPDRRPAVAARCGLGRHHRAASLARLSEDANRLQLKASVSQTISQVIGAYRELLRAQEQARIAREALGADPGAARGQPGDDPRRANGRILEIVQTEADAASQELNVEESTNQVDSARLAL
ncbi:TolC family protein, partial [Pseudomonas aeruginosa]